MNNNISSDNTPKIRVVVRKRPLSKKEINRGDPDIVEVRQPNTIIVRETKLVNKKIVATTKIKKK